MPFWEFENKDAMYSLLIGKSFGENPTEKIAEIRADKEYWAQTIASTLNLSQQHKVIEIGPGVGFLTNYMAKLVQEIHCCDISRSFLSASQQECISHKNVFFHEIYSGSLSFALDKSFDAIYSHNVFIHLNIYDVYRYFRDFDRVLTADGQVCFDIVDSSDLSDGPTPLFGEMASLYDEDSAQLPHLINYLPLPAVTGIAQHFNFKLVKKMRVGTSTFLQFKRA